MSHPKVTAICIFHNADRFLSEAIESVLTQDFGDFELLLVDDGSNDRSTAIALSHALRCPARISYLEHPERRCRGVSAARNLGLSHALGEYVAFIDADDRWRPRKLREQVTIMDAHPEIGLVAGTVNHWRSWEGGQDQLVPTGHMVDAIAPAPEAALATAPLGKAAAPCPSDAMIRRSVLEEVGCFEPSFTGAFEDAACFGKLLLAAPVYFSRRIWADVRIHDGSCMAVTRREGHYQAKRAIFLRWYCDYLKRCSAPRRKAVLQAARLTRWQDTLAVLLRRPGRTDGR